VSAFSIEHVHEVDAPAEAVWQVIVDLDLYPAWNSFVLSCRSTLVPGSPIDMRVRVGRAREPALPRGRGARPHADALHVALRALRLARSGRARAARAPSGKGLRGDERRHRPARRDA
jgi:hypothetical protein